MHTSWPSKLARASSRLRTEGGILEISESAFIRFLFCSLPSVIYINIHKSLTRLNIVSFRNKHVQVIKFKLYFPIKVDISTQYKFTISISDIKAPNFIFISFWYTHTHIYMYILLDSFYSSVLVPTYPPSLLSWRSRRHQSIQLT